MDLCYVTFLHLYVHLYEPCSVSNLDNESAVLLAHKLYNAKSAIGNEVISLLLKCFIADNGGSFKHKLLG